MMKKILLPILMVLIIGLSLISCDLFGGSDDSGSSNNPKTLFFINVTSDRYVFDIGENIKPHLTVKGYYTDGTEKTITDYSMVPSDGIVTSTTDSVTVSYTEGGVTKTDEVHISVGSIVTLNDIEVITDTNFFNVGENIKDHLTVKGIYSDGVKTISKDGYSTNLPNDKVTTTTNSVKISYTDGSDTKEKTISITVNLLSSIEVIKRTEDFYEGENIKDFITVKGHYTDGSEKTLSNTDYNVSPSEIVTSTTNYTVEISYTENSITKKKSITINVTDDTSDYEIVSFWFDYFSGVIDKDSVTSISLVKEKPSDVTETELVTTDDKFSYYKKRTDLYVVGERMLFGSYAINLFSDFTNVKQINLSFVDTSNVTNVISMFRNCKELTELDLSNFDTSNITDMSYMFEGCEKLTTLDLSKFDTSNVTNMEGMFANCKELTELNLSNFDTSNVENMSRMFRRCEQLTSITFGDNFKTSKVTYMDDMFYMCDRLTSLDLSNFDTSKVTDMSSMFDGCEELTTLDLSSFDITSTTDRPSIDTSDMFDEVPTTIPIYVNDPIYWTSKFGGYIFTTKP